MGVGTNGVAARVVKKAIASAEYLTVVQMFAILYNIIRGGY